MHQVRIIWLMNASYWETKTWFRMGLTAADVTKSRYANIIELPKGRRYLPHSFDEMPMWNPAWAREVVYRRDRLK